MVCELQPSLSGVDTRSSAVPSSSSEVLIGTLGALCGKTRTPILVPLGKDEGLRRWRGRTVSLGLGL